MDKQRNLNPIIDNDYISNLLEKQNFNLTELEKSNLVLINTLGKDNIDDLSGILNKREGIEKNISKLDGQINKCLNNKIKKNTGILNNNNLTLIKIIHDRTLNISKSFQIIIEMIKKYQSILEQNLNSVLRETKAVESYTSFNKGHTQYELKG